LLPDLNTRSAALVLEPDCINDSDEINGTEAFKNALGVIYLGICQQLWEPLEAIEYLGEDKLEPFETFVLIDACQETCAYITSLEAGKRAARDLCGTEPERMAPPLFAQYCEQIFNDTSVSCQVESDIEVIARDYPLLFAVARASVEVERHKPRVIKLEYTGEGAIEQTFYLAGKGITYDTGGADLKVNGHMAGMSRDKGGAAAVAGLMLSLHHMQPKGIRVVAQIGAVRNSIGAEAYVPDEIIMSHAGVRVRVGNTDAEGRMVLSDLLSHMRVQAIKNPSNTDQLFSVATLTGHAAIALGPYTALVENGPARQLNTGKRISAAGELWADPCEQSRLRKEDFDFILPRTNAEDVLSSNNKPSVSTVRGHQFPAAFLIVSSGLDQHDSASQQPLAYTHVDIAGSAVENMDWQHGKPTAAPIAALLKGLMIGNEL
jgi:leucyl aminopeptidase